MSVGVFQPKNGSEYDGFADTVYAQVDEFEVWQGGTRQACREVFGEYGGHKAGGVISGDGSESRDTTSPDETDWDIVREVLGRQMPMFTVQPGTYQPEDSDTWSNPPVRDRINAGNWLLEDGHGNARAVFLPESGYDSGGLKASVAQVEKDEQGKIDKSIDKTSGRSDVQSHFADVWSYMAYDRLRRTGQIGRAMPADEAIKRAENAIKTGDNAFGTGTRQGAFTSF